MLKYHQSMTNQYDTESFYKLCDEAEKMDPPLLAPVLIGYYEYIIDILKRVNDQPVYGVSKRYLIRVLKQWCPTYSPEPILDLFQQHGFLIVQKYDDGTELYKNYEVDKAAEYIERKRAAGKMGGKASQGTAHLTPEQRQQVAPWERDLAAMRQAQTKSTP